MTATKGPVAAVLKLSIRLERLEQEASRLPSAGGPLPVTQPRMDFLAGGAGQRAEPQSQLWVGMLGAGGRVRTQGPRHKLEPGQ